MMSWIFLKRCGEHLDEVEARSDTLMLKQSRLLQYNRQVPADLVQNINALVQLRRTLSWQFRDLIPDAHLDQQNACLLHGADARAIHRAMRQSGSGFLFWYRVGHSAKTNMTSIRRNLDACGMPVAPVGHEFDWVLAETGNDGLIFDLGHQPYVG